MKHATSLFISDLHLHPSQPAITDLFIKFLGQAAQRAQALYILGDLFEAWLGDDDPSELGNAVTTALRSLSASGVPIYSLRGNRDFLLGEHFAAASGVQLLPDSVVIDLHGEPTLLLHGDTLCLDDHDYQKFRAQVRDPGWQAQILRLPIAQRQALAAQLREGSRAAGMHKSAEITDVNVPEVERVLRQQGLRRLIHGHTHRPAIHEWLLDGQLARRAVLGDWSEQQGSVLCCDSAGWRLQPLY